MINDEDFLQVARLWQSNCYLNLSYIVLLLILSWVLMYILRCVCVWEESYEPLHNDVLASGQ